MADGINTGGGASSSGDVTPGKDFIGRDSIVTNIEASSHSHSMDAVKKLESRVLKIEELLGGYLGIPGLTQEIRSMKEDVADIKTELQRTYIHPMQYVFLLVSTGALVISVILTIFGLWG